jgi:HlyB family type I secretion system ABC transporter
MSAVECGAACLAMILSYYGRRTSVSEIRERQGVGRDGLSAFSIVQAARNYGLRVKALSLQTSDLRPIHLPALVHWGFNHFLVVERWSPRYVDVVDPASGRKRMTADEFDTGFTGIVIMLEPGAQFDRHTRPPLLTLRTYVLQYMNQAPGMFFQLLVASLLLQVFGLTVPVLTKVIVDQIIPQNMSNLLTLLGAGVLIVLLARLVTSLLRASLLAYLEAHIDTHITSSFFKHLLSLPQRFFQQRSSGDILARVASNSTIRDVVCISLVPAFLDGSLVIVYLVILLSQSLEFGIIVLLIGLLQIMLLLGTYRPIRTLARRELEARGKSQGYETEMLTGIETLKAAGAEQRAFHRWSNLFLDHLNISVRQAYLTSIIDTFVGALALLAPLILLWVGTIKVLNGSMQLGTMLALNALAGTFLGPLTSLISDGQLLQVVRSHFERIADVMEAKPEQDVQVARQPPRLTGRIALEHVGFRYDPHAPNVLKDIVVHIEPGQKIAIVGRTGSGKSTLGKLLLGLYLPTEGEILYDGIPLHNLDYSAVRAQFGVVVQNAHIFSGSIRQNITLNDPNMSMERVVDAAQLAAFHDDIVHMSMGYETFVSERGSALSGGQCQRLALARALAHRPAIVLLDEATSALDVLTEQVVERNLKALSCTQIIIAHRLSTIRNADCILMLDQGSIIEQGSHQELLRKNGRYANLIQSQLATGEVKATF